MHIYINIIVHIPSFSFRCYVFFIGAFVLGCDTHGQLLHTFVNLRTRPVTHPAHSLFFYDYHSSIFFSLYR